MVERMKICFVGSLSHTFVKRDYEILKKYFDVDVVKLPNLYYKKQGEMNEAI